MMLMLSAQHRQSGHMIVGIGDNHLAASIAFGNSRNRIPSELIPKDFLFGDMFNSMYKAKLTFADHNGWILNLRII